MKFGEKLKGLRESAGLTQEAVGKACGVTLRSIANYEAGNSVPKYGEVYARLSDLFNVSADYLVTEQEEFIAKAYAGGGIRGKRKAELLVEQISGLFAGGDISAEDKDAVMKTIQDAYWEAKATNKLRYGKKHNRNKEGEKEEND